MFSMTLTVGASILVILMIVNIILSKMHKSNAFTVYIPAAVVFGIGVIGIFIAAFGRIEVLGLGLGGWGIACLFAAAIGVLVTSLVDVYTHA